MQDSAREFSQVSFLSRAAEFSVGGHGLPRYLGRRLNGAFKVAVFQQPGWYRGIIFVPEEVYSFFRAFVLSARSGSYTEKGLVL